MRCSVLVTWLALAAVGAAAHDGAARQSQDGRPDPALSALGAAGEPHSRQQRWVVFRPMFVTKQRQRALNRVQQRSLELRRQSRHRGQRPRRALHFPAGGAAGEESGLALRVAVNDLLFQSAPANDLPETRTTSGGGSGPGLRPILLARLRAASREREPAAEEEAFLLMSAAGGRPAIVPAPTTRPRQAPPRPAKQHGKHNKHHHKQRKGEKQRRRARRDAEGTVTNLGATLDAVSVATKRHDDIAERVKKYDAQGMYPAYSYTHGRFTRGAVVAAKAAPGAGPAQDVEVMKVKVHGAVDDEDVQEGMEAAENIVFRPLFAHRQLQAAKQDAKRRRSGLAKKPVKPAVKPLRRRQYRPQTAFVATTTPVRRIPAATAWFHRSTYLKSPARPRPRYQHSPYRRVVYYH